jgi:hypothetical protein
MERIWINQHQHVVQAITFFAASRFGRSDSAFASDMDKKFLVVLFLFRIGTVECGPAMRVGPVAVDVEVLHKIYSDIHNRLAQWQRVGRPRPPGGDECDVRLVPREHAPEFAGRGRSTRWRGTT